MQPLLEAFGITKQFPGTLALDNVQLELLPGEIHVVMGENGAGKSTLMKILSGVIFPDGGELRLEGKPVAFKTPYQALEHGIAIVYQELNVVSTLTVAENIFPGRLPVNIFGMVRYRELFWNAERAIQKLTTDIDPRAFLGDLSIAQQQLVEIAKALSRECKVLILDEPTSALTDREADILLTLLRRLANEGIGILYISHKLKEVFQVADRVTVLRDGKYVGTHAISDTSPDMLIRMMVGRELGTLFPHRSEKIGKPLLQVQNLRVDGFTAHNSFELYEGEILGFSGLIGSGRTELARTLFGAEPKIEGQVLLEGVPLHIDSPQKAIQHGIGYLPEDRKAAGLFLEMNIRLNVAATIIKEVSGTGFVRPSRERAIAEQSVEQLAISTSGIEQEVRRLSGGNQQKTLIAKWLAIKPKILIVDEPTRGIDVGAKREIHFLLRKLAESGVGVIIISSELPEILGMCDRILVMHEGSIVAEYQADEATEEKIMRVASGQTSGSLNTEVIK
jgi:ribose transport system ATP-binding protein